MSPETTEVLDVEEKPGPKATRRSFRVVLANIWGLHKNLSDLSLAARGGDVFFSETLVSSRLYISKLMVSDFERPMQLLNGEVDRFQGLAQYVREVFRHVAAQL